MGNPTSYLGKTLTWEGKQLTQTEFTTAGILQRYTYEYDENGLRVGKTYTVPSLNASEHTKYYYNGSVLIGMSVGSDVRMRFSYDASGNVVAVDYSTDSGSTFTTYYYVRNAQNDVVKLIDNSGNSVVEYIYDSWGKVIASTSSLTTGLKDYQPFRYRGYVYDKETGWYYLQSRYYDPTTCRFISADVLLSTGQGIIGHNAFAYCNNDPVIAIDSNGTYSVSVPLFDTMPDDSSGSGIPASPNYDPYVYDQHDPSIADLSFGLGTIGKNGCGLIALYNVSVASGDPETFKSLRRRLAYNPFKDLLFGFWGTDPVWLTMMLKRKFGSGNVSFTTNTISGDYSAIIVLYLGKENNQYKYAHYFAAINIGNGIYKAYNDYDINNGNINDVLNSVPGKTIGIWGIDF